MRIDLSQSRNASHLMEREGSLRNFANANADWQHCLINLVFSVDTFLIQFACL